MHAQHSDRKKNNWTVWASITALILGIGIWQGLPHLSSRPYTIFVDGEPVVTLESKAAVNSILDRARTRNLENISPRSARFMQEVRFQPSEAGTALADPSEALGAIEKAVTVQVEFFAIVANDVPIAAFKRKEDAEKALDLVKRHYEKDIQNAKAESRFKERVFVELRYVELDKLCSSAQDGFQVLISATEEDTYHTVERGDRVVRIAGRYKISLQELKALNPGLNIEKITEGDQMLIRRAKPPLTVISEAVLTKTVTITPPPGAKAGTVGQRQMRVRVTYVNGKLASEEILGQITTWDKAQPQPRTRR